MPFSPELVQVFWKLKLAYQSFMLQYQNLQCIVWARIDTGPHNHIIDMHPTFIATGPLPYEPAPGDIALLILKIDRTKRGHNFFPL